MRTAIYNKVKRLAALFIAGCAMTTGVMAQENLHLFYKDGEHKKLEITENTRVDFVKQPYIENIAGYYNDTIYIAANAGRTMGFGWMTSNFPWTATTDANWLTIRQEDFEKYAYPRGGGIKESAYLIFTEANFSDQERTATITFNARGASEQITVVQLPYLLSLSPVGESHGNEAVTEMEEFVAWNSTEFYAVAYPNFGVKLTSYPEWMTLDTITHGGADFTLDKVAQVPDSVQVTYEDLSYNYTYARFYFEPNNSPENRSGEIVFEGRGQRAVLTVTQEGLNETIILRDAQELHKQLYHAFLTGSDTHFDFGFPAIMLFADSRGMDMVAMNKSWNWFSAAVTYNDMGTNKWFTYIYWETLYKHINTINETVNQFENQENKELFYPYLAQAYALRAFDYFYLAQIYSHTYAGNEEAPCVPIVTEQNMQQEYTEGIPRATVREVYAYILENLNKAIQLMKDNNVTYPDKGLMSVEAAYALRARINLVMNNWEAAANDAERVVEMSEATPYTRYQVSTPGFTDINDEAWLWGFKVDETDDVVTSGIINWPAQVCSMTGNGYTTGTGTDDAQRRISKALWYQIPETDVRKGWWIDENMHSPLLVSAYGQEWAAQIPYTANMAPYTNVKFGPDKGELFNPTNAQDIPLIRIEEMYLIWVEAQAMLGNMEEATEVLTDFVQEYRDPAYTCKATTPEELVDAVWMQRRIELWGEGHSYFDLMRLKKATDRRGAGFEPEYVFNIPDGDAARIYQIPSSAMSSNPQLVQNPEPEMPQPVEDIEFVTYKNGVFTSELFGGSWEQAMEVHATDKNLYRLPDYIAEGYDLLFYWDENTSEVAFAKGSWETGYVHSEYGMIMAYAQSITYDEATKTFTFGVEYRVEAGTFGGYYDTFTLASEEEDDEEEETTWKWFSADAEGNQIVVDTEDEASFVNFTEGWWGEYFYDVRIKFIEEDGLRHCVAYREDGIWGEGMDIEFHFTMATEPNEMGEYDIDVPRQYMGWEYADTASVYFYDWYNYFITDGGYADTTWVDADDFYAKNGANYPRSYSDGKGGFYFNMKYHVPAAGGGWTPTKFDIVATINGAAYQKDYAVNIVVEQVFNDQARIQVRFGSDVAYAKYYWAGGRLSNAEIADEVYRMRNDVDGVFSNIEPYETHQFGMDGYSECTLIVVPFDENGNPQRPAVGKPCETVVVQYNEPNYVETHLGTYTYSFRPSGETTLSGMKLYKDINNPYNYYIENWGGGVNLNFYWDGDSEVEVYAGATGYELPNEGAVYVVDIANVLHEEVFYPGINSYRNSYYDAETRTFHFTLMYNWGEAQWVFVEETFTLDEVSVPDSYELIGEGDYTYTCMYAEPSVDSGYKLYRDTNNENTYVIADWFYGVNFTFTWDGDSDVRVLNQFSGYTGSYGDVFVMEASEYEPEWSDVKSYYDAETKTFYFAIVYYCDAGYYGYDYETFTLSEEQAAAMSRSRERMSTPTLKVQKPHKMIETSNKEVLLVK